MYVKDRGYACFKLLQAIHDIRSYFVCRVRDNGVYELIEDRPPPPQAHAMGLVSDQIVWLGCAEKRDELKQPLRILKIACTPHHKRAHHARATSGGGPEQGEFLLIATNLLDLPVEVIALIYRKRWTIELFFRFSGGSSTCWAAAPGSIC